MQDCLTGYRLTRKRHMSGSCIRLCDAQRKTAPRFRRVVVRGLPCIHGRPAVAPVSPDTVPDPLSLNLPPGGYADQRGKTKQGSESWRRFGSPALHNKNFPDLTVFHDGYLSPGCRHDKADSICHLGNPRNRGVPCPVTIGNFQRKVVNDKMPP